MTIDEKVRQYVQRATKVLGVEFGGELIKNLRDVPPEDAKYLVANLIEVAKMIQAEEHRVKSLVHEKSDHTIKL